VAHGVFGHVDEEAVEGGGEMFAADGSRFRERGGIDVTNFLRDGVEGLTHLCKEFVAGGAGLLLFGAEGFHLSAGEGAAFGVGEETVRAAGDVTDVEADGAEV
jgi:hypothetical protein